MPGCVRGSKGNLTVWGYVTVSGLISNFYSHAVAEILLLLMRVLRGHVKICSSVHSPVCVWGVLGAVMV